MPPRNPQDFFKFLAKALLKAKADPAAQEFQRERAKEVEEERLRHLEEREMEHMDHDEGVIEKMYSGRGRGYYARMHAQEEAHQQQVKRVRRKGIIDHHGFNDEQVNAIEHAHGPEGLERFHPDNQVHPDTVKHEVLRAVKAYREYAPHNEGAVNGGEPDVSNLKTPMPDYKAPPFHPERPNTWFGNKAALAEANKRGKVRKSDDVAKAAKKPEVAEALRWSGPGLGNHYMTVAAKARAPHGDYEVGHIPSSSNGGKGHYSVKLFERPIHPRSFSSFGFADTPEAAKSNAEEDHALRHYAKQIHGKTLGHDLHFGSSLHEKIRRAFPDQGAKRFIGMHPDQVKHEIARVLEAYPDDLEKARKPLDENAARELKLHIDNTQFLDNHRSGIQDNLQRKMRFGKYDHSKAPKLWRYLADNAARHYTHQANGGDSGGWMDHFSPATRDHVAQQLADEHHPRLLATYAGISEQDAEHAIRAYGPDVSRRWHGMHPDMIQHEVERAKGAMDKAEYKGKNFRNQNPEKPTKPGTKYGKLSEDALKDLRHNVGSGQVRNPDRAPGEEADYARRASGNKRDAGPGDALFAVGAKKGPTMAGYHDRTIYSYGQHWPVVAHYPEHNLLVVNTHNYGGATKRIVDSVLTQAPKQFRGVNIVHVDHPDYQETSKVMRGNLHGVHEHLKLMATSHPDEDRRALAGKHAAKLGQLLGAEVKKSEAIRKGIALFKSLVDLEDFSKAKVDYAWRKHPGKKPLGSLLTDEDRIRNAVEVRDARRGRFEAQLPEYDGLELQPSLDYGSRVSSRKPKLPKGGRENGRPFEGEYAVPAGDLVEKARGKEKWRAQNRGTREQGLGTNAKRQRAAFASGERGIDQAAVEEEGKSRINRYLHSIGLHGEYGKPGEPTREMGRRGPNTVDTTYSQQHGGPEGPHRQQLIHEVSHAQQVPVGTTLSEYQQGIGMPGDRQAARAARMGTYEETKAHAGEAGVSRRAGLPTFKRPAVGGSGSVTAHAKEYARQNQRALDAGINRFEPETGERVQPNTPDTRINLRAAGMPHEAMRLLRERMERYKNPLPFEKSELQKAAKPSKDLEWHEMDNGFGRVSHIAHGYRNRRYEIEDVTGHHEQRQRQRLRAMGHDTSHLRVEAKPAYALGVERGSTIYPHSTHPTMEAAKAAAHREHVAHHYGLKDHDIAAVEAAWPEQGVARFHGMHPDQVKHELARAHENLGKGEVVSLTKPHSDGAFHHWALAHYHRGEEMKAYKAGDQGRQLTHSVLAELHDKMSEAHQAQGHVGEGMTVDGGFVPEGGLYGSPLWRKLQSRAVPLTEAMPHPADKRLRGQMRKSAATDFNAEANNQVTRALLAAGIPIRVHGEPKTPESLQAKIKSKRRSGRTYYGPSDVHDAYRGRISVLSNDLKDIERAAKVVRSKFEVDDVNSPDYAHDPEANYGRTHLVLRMNGIPYELQIGTADAEEYIEPVHDSIYKNPKCDPKLRAEHEAILGAIKGLNAKGKSFHSDTELEGRIKALHAAAGEFQKSLMLESGPAKDARLRRISAVNREMTIRANRGLIMDKADYQKKALVFSTVSGKGGLHDPNCSVVKTAGQGAKRHLRAIHLETAEDEKNHVDDLTERGYPVKAHDCLKLSKAEEPEKDAEERKPFDRKPSLEEGGEDQSIMDANVEGAMEAMGFGHVTGRLSANAMALRHLAYKMKVHQNRQNKEAFTRKPLGKDEEKPDPAKKAFMKSNRDETT